VAERLDGSSRRLAKILQYCKFSRYECFFASGGPGPEASASPASWMIRPCLSHARSLVVHIFARLWLRAHKTLVCTAFVLHKVVEQRVWGVLESLVIVLSQIVRRLCQWKSNNRLILGKDMDKSLVARFYGSQCSIITYVHTSLLEKKCYHQHKVAS